MVWRGGGGGLKEGGEISMWFDNGNMQTLSLSSSVESSKVLVLHEANCIHVFQKRSLRPCRLKLRIHMRGAAWRHFVCGKNQAVFLAFKIEKVNPYERRETRVYRLFGKFLCLRSTSQHITLNLPRLCLFMSSC